MLLALLLSSLIGLALGLLGGGGSILTVPILVYGLGLEAKPAIATSLLVVAVTSLFALASHARKGLVDFRTGLVFGGAGMVGAYAGGAFASLLPGWLLLLGFASVMAATAVAMLRGNGREPTSEREVPVRLPLGRVIWHGSIVGVVTGLVGAGGGFMIVPALVLLGGMSMRRAVATSLLVIAMKSLAGFAGHMSHVAIDWQLAAMVAASAIGGSLIGGMLSRKLAEDSLRRVFAWFVMAMAVFVVSRELPAVVTGSAAFQALFVERWPFWVGGLAIGAVVLSMLYLDNKQLGVSTGCSELCSVHKDSAARSSWRLRFLGGIVLGGAVASAFAGHVPTFALGSFDTVVGASPFVKIPVLLAAGVLIGYGARVAGGCTSGHGIVGTALGAKSSWVATALFMVSGFVTTFALGLLSGT